MGHPGENNYKATVEKIQQYIVAGDVMQVVPSQRLSSKFSAPPVELYRKLRLLNPSPYIILANFGSI
jgi:anthranilate synthase component 1